MLPRWKSKDDVFRILHIAYLCSPFSNMLYQVERLFWNGCRVITFRNRTRKEIGVDKSVTVTFFNGDVKRILADGTVVCVSMSH